MNVKTAILALVMASLLAAPRSAAGDGDALAARHESAVARYLANDVVESMRALRALAGEGYAPSQAYLAEILDESGENHEAARLFKLAADQGNPAGLFGLGFMHLKGEGVEKDEAKGMALVRQAAEKEYKPALRVMMLAYRNGLYGLAADEAQSALWKEKLGEDAAPPVKKNPPGAKPKAR